MKNLLKYICNAELFERTVSLPTARYFAPLTAMGAATIGLVSTVLGFGVSLAVDVCTLEIHTPSNRNLVDGDFVMTGSVMPSDTEVSVFVRREGENSFQVLSSIMPDDRGNWIVALSDRFDVPTEYFEIITIGNPEFQARPGERFPSIPNGACNTGVHLISR